MQLGFVIDQSRCIGCHACTVACKSENDVPVGSFRTWVKYVEDGTYPTVQRSFTVLRCNQCSSAPCITICPVTALAKRPDGIVDLDHDVCIGCKACMQGCPYDALYLDHRTGTARKCHFCAHRTEIGLAPACAVVCPTEAIVPGDFHDPASAVSRLAQEHDLRARKPGLLTEPNVLYRDAAPAGLDPLATREGDGFLWAQRLAGPGLDARLFDALESKAGARTVYDVDHRSWWGTHITAYLFLKSLAAGALLAGLPLLAPFAGVGGGTRAAALLVPALALLALGATLGLLVADLERPERFLSIMLRPNWDSWLARGSYVLAVYGLLLTVWLGAGVLGVPPGGAAGGVLGLATACFAALSASYTAWLFGQAKGRVLWCRRGLWLHLLAQAGVAGAALLLLVDGVTGGALGPRAGLLPHLLLGALVLHVICSLSEEALAPPGREDEYRRAVRLVTHGPFARAHWLVGIFAGGALPLALLLVPDAPVLHGLAAALALAGLWVEEDVLVHAGQALPIS